MSDDFKPGILEEEKQPSDCPPMCGLVVRVFACLQVTDKGCDILHSHQHISAVAHLGGTQLCCLQRLSLHEKARNGSSDWPQQQEQTLKPERRWLNAWLQEWPGHSLCDLSAVCSSEVKGGGSRRGTMGKVSWVCKTIWLLGFEAHCGVIWLRQCIMGEIYNKAKGMILSPGKDQICLYNMCKWLIYFWSWSPAMQLFAGRCLRMVWHRTVCWAAAGTPWTFRWLPWPRISHLDVSYFFSDFAGFNFLALWWYFLTAVSSVLRQGDY